VLRTKINGLVESAKLVQSLRLKKSAVVSQVRKSLSETDSSHSDKLLMDLKDSVNFMSGQFDDFNTQLHDTIKSINAVRDENKQLKEQNLKLTNELSVVNKKINFIELTFFEIILK